MGQAQSDEYTCNSGETGERLEDIADSELNSSKDSSDDANESAADKDQQQTIKPIDNNNNNCKLTSSKGTANKILGLFYSVASPSNADEARPTRDNQRLRGNNRGQKNHQRQQQHVRKLSNVSNRNIQLLSLRPRAEKDAYADDLRKRRRSSLINLILGAPSSGPKFSDDLCSLSSHMSELCNFGIEFFPDGFNQQRRNNASNGSACSTNSSLRARYAELTGSNIELGLNGLAVAKLPNQFVGGGGVHAPRDSCGQMRRRSSFGSLSSFKAIQEAPAARQQTTTPGAKLSQSSACVKQQISAGPDGSRSTQVECGAAKQIKGSPVAAADGNDGGDNNVAPVDGENRDSSDATLNQAVSPTTRKQHFRNRHPTLTSTLASIDLMSSFEKHDNSNLFASAGTRTSASFTTFKGGPTEWQDNLRGKLSTGRINRTGRVLRRTGSELSLYSSLSAESAGSHRHNINNDAGDNNYFRYNQLFDENNNPLRSATGKQKQKSHSHRRNSPHTNNQLSENPARETKSIIMMQVCLPFILAGLGNMAAGLVLNRMAKWRAFREVPIFFVLLPSFVGLKGNIEMTLASRLSTLSNLNLLDSGKERRRAYISNLILILSQAIGLSVFASLISIFCETLLGKLETKGGFVELLEVASLVVLPSALIAGIVLSILSSVVVSLAIMLANLIQVNPDNLSTLIAALYGDVSCVLTYGLFAELMFSLRAQNIIIWPISILTLALVCYPILLYAAYKFKGTTSIALSSIPPMMTGIMVSIGSGAILSKVVGKFSLIALYQPVVNGFGANLIAVQASRVSTWLWCKTLSEATVAKNDEQFEAILEGKKIQGSLASFADPRVLSDTAKNNSDTSSRSGCNDIDASLKLMAKRFLNLLWRIVKAPLWSFSNSSPNSIAARLLLMMLVPAHTIYFFAIWFLAPSNHVSITWQFYLIYITLCLVQVFVLLSICEPLMTLLMRNHLDPDVFGISFLMALADLVGTVCLTSAFTLLARIGDKNAH